MNPETNGIDLRDERTFQELFRRFYPRVRLFAGRFLGDPMAVGDVVQEAFLYMWQQALRLPDEEAFKAYLYHCVKNKCLNYLRDCGRRGEMADLEEAAAEQAAEEWQADHWLIESELKARLLEEIDRLPEVRKEIMLMRLDGRSFEEISQELRLNINTLKTYKKQIYKELRFRLKDLEEGGALGVLLLGWLCL